MFNSLRVRLTLLFVILTIIPLVISGALIASQGSEALQGQSVEFQDQLARQTAISLGAFFKERQNELFTITHVAGLDNMDNTAQKDMLLTLLSEQPAYYELTVANADGQETIDVTRGEIVTSSDLTSRADDLLFQSAVETGQVTYSPVYFNDGARDRLITMVVPIEDLFTGKTGLVLIAELRFQNVQEAVLRNLDLESGEDVYVVDADGVVIAHRNPNLVLKETVFDLPEANGRHTGLSGSDVVLAMNTISLENRVLIVVAETSYSNATALSTRLTNLSAVITGATLLFAAIIVAVVVNQVVNPIAKLSRVAKAIQNGDYSKRTEMKRKDEIGQFAAAFNSMTDAIEKRETDLREQADALRVATARAKEAARVKGEFLANVSHELRTPLNAIIGFSDMLLAGMSGPLTDKQTHKMGRLKENGTRLLTLINDLLDLTRIESGRLEVMENSFSPRAVAERISAQMESLAVESKLQFETVISSEVPNTLLGDEKRVEQVMVNLLSNAFKFTKEGSITLGISANFTDRTWSIEVTDTGIGIPPHAVNIIFEEFRQLDGSYSRAYKGSGLGLAITRNLVRMMGGKIGVKSTLGNGSTFTITLPLNEQQATAQQPILMEAVAT
jgi:signal transduction histidine kinase